VGATAHGGTPLDTDDAALLEELDRLCRDGITAAELTKAKAQLRARLVFDSDSVTNIAHQLGYFETIASVDTFIEAPSRIAAVSVDEVSDAARRMLTASNPTVGYFDPIPVD